MSNVRPVSAPDPVPGTDAPVRLGGAFVAYCPLPGCHWASFTAPGAAEHPSVLAEVFGWGVFAATARAQRLEAHEQEIREHLRSHTAEEWAMALAAARARIAELEGGDG